MVSRRSRLIVSPLALAALALAAQAPAHAGTGTFSNGKYAFCASVRFNATPDQLARIRTAFANGSQVLADATDGQQSFGKIKLVNNSGGTQAADYWINAGAGRAYATYGHYGMRGEHVNLFYASNFTGQQGADGDAYTIAHEHAHHSWGVADEYSGPGGNAEDAPASANTASLNYSLMDNYFTRGGRSFGGPYTLNEFCTAANHDPDHNTWQHKINKKSVWETIAAHPTRAVAAPQALPVPAPPPAHSVDFSNMAGMRNVMLLLDRSGSMADAGKLDAAKRSAIQYISIYPDNDGLGVASFSDAGSVNLSLTPASAASRAAARSAVGSLAATGSTNIGGGILTALGQLTSQLNRSCEEIIVLLTDGEHNVGTPPETGIAAAQAEGVTVMTVGLGSDITTAGQSTLQNIATQTGGKFYGMSQPDELAAVFLQLSADTAGQGMLMHEKGMVEAGKAADLPALLEDGASEVTFALTLPKQQDNVELSLKTPSGQILRASDAGNQSGLTFSSGPTWRIFRVAAPQAGTWTMIAGAGQDAGAAFETAVFAQHDGVQLNASIEQNTLEFPAPVQLQVTPTFAGQNVVGGSVTGTVRRPDGSEVQIQLYDDGLDEHGDAIPDDGIYGARFAQYQGDGTYRFELKLASEKGETYAGEALFADQPSNEKAVPVFTRVATATAVVSGVPVKPVASLALGPETLNGVSDEQVITAWIGLSGKFSAANIDPASVHVSAINGVRIRPIYPVSGSAQLADVNADGIMELKVRFNRAELQSALQPGSPEIMVEGAVDGEIFSATATPFAVDTGKPAP